MKTIAIILASFWVVTGAMAQGGVDCKAQAATKNLHGAALTSFTKKCCSDQAKAQKLHGAAETSFTNKCISDATGS